MGSATRMAGRILRGGGSVPARFPGHLFLDARPGVAQGHNAVEHRAPRLRVLAVVAEIAGSLELVKVTGRAFRDRFLHYLRYTCGLELRLARPVDHLVALGRAVRESMIDREILTNALEQRAKAGKSLMTELRSAVDELKLEDLENTQVVSRGLSEQM